MTPLYVLYVNRILVSIAKDYISFVKFPGRAKSKTAYPVLPGNGANVPSPGRWRHSRHHEDSGFAQEPVVYKTSH